MHRTAQTRGRSRTWRAYLGIGLRGAAMGAADVVPGVSGGTIAMISGIYEELIDALAALGPAALDLFRSGFRAFWVRIHGDFLLALVLGIGLSILSLSRLLLWLLATQPILLWSFFFGLVLASAHLIGRRIGGWSWEKILALLLGALVAYGISRSTPLALEPSPLFLFLGGSIAICAMILPGISGSFLLVLLGLYPTVLSAVSELRFSVLLLFGAGALLGLLSFSRVLAWLLHRYHDCTVAALVGVMLGSLHRVWPWKQVLAWTRNHRGEQLPLLTQNRWPWDYSTLPADQLLGTSPDPQLWPALGLAALGIVLIFLLERGNPTRR